MEPAEAEPEPAEAEPEPVTRASRAVADLSLALDAATAAMSPTAPRVPQLALDQQPEPERQRALAEQPRVVSQLVIAQTILLLLVISGSILTDCF